MSRIGEEPDLDRTVREGAASWNGPSPRAAQSRWWRERRRPVRGRSPAPLALIVSAAGAAALVVVCLFLLTARSGPGGRLPMTGLSHVLPGGRGPLVPGPGSTPDRPAARPASEPPPATDTATPVPIQLSRTPAPTPSRSPDDRAADESRATATPEWRPDPSAAPRPTATPDD